MKKTMKWAMAAVLSLGLAACPADDSKTEDKGDAVAKKTDEGAAKGDTKNASLIFAMLVLKRGDGRAEVSGAGLLDLSRGLARPTPPRGFLAVPIRPNGLLGLHA